MVPKGRARRDWEMARRSEKTIVPDRKPKPKGKERGKEAKVGWLERLRDGRKGKADRLERVRQK